MPITASILYNVVHCPQRVALDAFGDASKRDEENAFVRLLWERGTLFERETIDKLQQPFLDLSHFGGDEKERLTLEAMRRGELMSRAPRYLYWDPPLPIARQRTFLAAWSEIQRNQQVPIEGVH